MNEKYPHLRNNGEFPNISNVNVYKFNSDFDYSLFDNTQMVITCCNVPWDLGEVHVGQRTISGIGNVVYFGSAEERDAWFNSIPDSDKFVWKTKFRNWHDSETVIIPLPFDRATHFNYIWVRFENLPVEYENETGWKNWFYVMRECFQKSPNATECLCMRDIWQTIIYDINIPYMILERGHAIIADTNVDEYLKNPIENSKMLITPDINFGDCNKLQKSEMSVINTDNQIAVFNCNSDIFDFKNIDSEDEGGTPAIVYNPVCDAPDNRIVIAIKTEDLEGFFEKVVETIPHFVQTVSAFYLIPEDMINLTEYKKFNSIQVYKVETKGYVIKGSYTFNKSDFGIEEKYADLSKLYTTPYSKLIITTDSGQSYNIDIQDCAGTLEFEAAINGVVDALNYVGHINGLNGNFELNSTFTLLNEHNFTATGSWFNTILSWKIPTYQLQISGYDEDRYSTKYTRAQMKLAADNSLYVAADNRELKYKIEINNANTNKTVSTNSAETVEEITGNNITCAKTISDNTAGSNKTTSDRSASAAKSIADTQASATRTIENTSASASYNMSLNTATVNEEITENSVECDVSNKELEISYNSTAQGFINAQQVALATLKNARIETDTAADNALIAGSTSAQIEYDETTTAISNSANTGSATVGAVASAGATIGGAAIAGAAVGSVVPGIGTVAGAAVGALIGGVSSLIKANIQNSANSASTTAAVNLSSTQASLTQARNNQAQNASTAENTASANNTTNYGNMNLNIQNSLISETTSNSSETNLTNAELAYDSAIYSANQAYSAQTSNASAQYNASTSNASTQYSASTSNASTVYSTESENNSTQYKNDNNNNELNYDNSIENISVTYDNAVTNAKLRYQFELNQYEKNYETESAAIDNLTNQNALRAPFRFGIVQNNGTDCVKPIGVTFNLYRQSDALIELTGNEWLKYGYYYKSYYKFDGDFRKMPKYTYWKCSDISMDAPNIPDSYMDALRMLLLGGVTVWNNPEDIGKTTIFENVG